MRQNIEYQDSESEMEVSENDEEVAPTIDALFFNKMENLESIQIQDNSNEKEFVNEEKSDIIDNIYDEIFQMYQEIMSDDGESDITLNALENDDNCSFKSYKTEDLALIDNSLIGNEKPIEDLNDKSETFYDYAREWMQMHQEIQEQSSLSLNGKRTLEDHQQEHFLIQNKHYFKNIESKKVEYQWKKRKKEINQEF
jgi:hypothetical protein